MHMFVSKYNEFVMDRNYQEGREQHATKMVSRKLRVGVPIEEHAEKVYTRSMYEKFYDELFEAGKHSVKAIEEEGQYVVSRTIRNSEESKNTCIVKVLIHLERTEIPKRNILKRWTKEAMGNKLEDTAPTSTESDQARKRALLLQTLRIVNGNDIIDEHRFIAAMEALTGRDSAVHHKRTDPTVEQACINNLDGELPLSCPERTIKGGRPPSTG
ncbi:hypothetical protein C2845_PM17G11090 [Panicum miliaceum]|uniref:Uncharacterized protein n=1 Tax=Panicum miliaceum TaxID=4540 RepID=A0A3L6Q199_PANMI|nr:hypothetical protein C2845_PM17G11090 [Panicum miliaceum]